MLVFRRTYAFFVRPYISPSPLSCKHGYTADTVKNGDRNGERSPAYKLILFAGGPRRASAVAPTAKSLSLAAAEKTGPGTRVTRGFVAFCGNNQQVVAKQGYECISSAVNTVARRVRGSLSLSLSLFVSESPSKDAAFVPMGHVRRRGPEGGKAKDEVLATIYTIDVVARPSPFLLFPFISLGLLALHDALCTRRSVKDPPWVLRREIPDFLLTNELSSLALNFLLSYLFFFDPLMIPRDRRVYYSSFGMSGVR